MDRQRIIRHSTRLSRAHDEEPEDGITAEAAEAHTADLDYPELGTVLSDRPDPGQQITVVGSRHTAAYPPLDDSWDDQEVAMPWHDSPAMDPPGRELHRGMSLMLPGHVHRIVHDESRPDAERGLALARHLLAHPHPVPARGQGLGYNWTDDPEVAKAGAENHDQHADWMDATPVVLHARTPPREDWEDNPYTLRERHRAAPPSPVADALSFGHDSDPWSFPSAEDREISMRSGSSVPFTGISWARPGHFYTRDTSIGGYADARHDPSYRHLDFPEGLSAKASATYGRPDDARDQEYNGGEMNDTGMYWAEPGEQPWAEQHTGPQQEAPPAPWSPSVMESPVLARLAQIEEAGQFFGTPRQEAVPGARHATTINGTQVDEHGDAPGHGTVPRAGEPNSYDERSTEGDGDPRWSGQGDPQRKEKNAATVGMYPEGMSAGGGPGLEIGAFTAARVPWTGHERATLHSWDDVPTGTEGDFVPSPMFTVPPAGGTPVPEEDRMRAEGAWETPVGYEDDGKPRQREFDSADWPPLSRGDRSGEMSETGPYNDREWTSEADPLEHRDGLRGRFDHTLSSREGEPWYEEWRKEPESAMLPEHFREPPEGTGLYDPQEWTPYATPEEHEHDFRSHVMHSLNSRHEAAASPEEEEAWRDHLRESHGWNEENIWRSIARGQRFSDMHDTLHQMGMADHAHSAPAGGREQSLNNMFGPDVRNAPGRKNPPGWDLARPQNGGSSGEDPMLGIIRSAPARQPVHPDMYETRDPARFRRMMSALETEHDDEGNSLDSGPDGAHPGPGDTHDDPSNSLDDGEGLPPQAWPLAGAGITEGGPAYTQGREDGHGGRVFPPPPPPPAPAGPGGAVPGEDGTSPDEDAEGDGKGKKIRLEISAHLGAFVAAGDPGFRFHFVASWSDVVAKAKRIRKEGHVRITHASAGLVIGEVRGDHDVYESGIQRPPGKRQTIQHWACGCPWASFHQDRALGTRYAGRPCSHVMALQFEAASRGMFGREVPRDEGPAAWSPAEVTVKSWPPYEGDPHKGHWTEYWRAPAVSKTAAHDPGCYYRHDGPCRTGSMARTAESRYHERPAEFYSEIGPNPEHDPHGDPRNPYAQSSHVLNGYLGPHLAGQIHFSRSDDGRAYHVAMMHTKEPAEGRGIASAMMDDLYDHVADHGRWLNHGARTGPGNYWWSGYAEPCPEANVHHAHPDEGWKSYWSPDHVASDMAENYRESRGEGAHTRPRWHPEDYPRDDRDEMWTRARGLQPPAQQATAALLAAGEDPGELAALAMLTGVTRNAIHVTADQANAPWGAENVSHHPPVKPYGATEQLNKDQDPGSYGFLAAPDPDNWGSIQDDSFTQSGITTAGSLPPHLAYPAPGLGAQEDQESFPYSDQSNTAGPSTSLTPHDPQGIRMEEALAELHNEPEPALPSTTGEDEIEATAAADGAIGGGDAGSGEDSQAPADVAALGEFGAVRNRPQASGTVRDRFRSTTAGTPMGDLNRETSPQAQQPSMVTQQPGMGSVDEPLMPDGQSIQTVGTQQWSGGGADSDETDVPAGQPQGSVDDIVASFQRSAAASQYNGGPAPGGSGMADGDIAAAARNFLQKTADVLPDREAAELIAEGRGQRARNLGLLRLEGTHYEDEDDDLARRGVSLDDFDDDVISV